MSSNAPGLFEKITEEAIRHGTAGFFRGLLGMIAALILLAYTKSTTESVRILIEFGLAGFLFFSMFFSAYSMLGGTKRDKQIENNTDLNPALPDLSDSITDDFAERLRQWMRTNQSR